MKSKQDAVSECQGGFTLVELVGVLIIIGILAIVAVPRFFDTRTFDSRAYYDQAMSMLRYAQKAAIARNSPVFVRLNGASIALCYDAACTLPVPPPAGRNSESPATQAACGGNAAWLCEGVPPGVAYASADAGGNSYNAATFFFDGLGKPFDAGDAPPNSTFNGPLVITVSGDGMARQIFVERETGYVHP